MSSSVASPMIYSRYANIYSSLTVFKVLPLFISLEIDCFHSQSTVNICIAGLNRRAGYATDYETVHLTFLFCRSHGVYSLLL